MTTADAALVAGATLGAWLVCYLVVVLATRPSTVRPAPATPDLGDEPPAVVNLLANRWRLTADAAEATLLDLAARRVLELRQPGADPAGTTVHVREPEPPELAAYEQHVLDRVQLLAVDGAVPVPALTFRDRQQARVWNIGLRRRVVADARRRGLSRRRIRRPVSVAMAIAALVAALGPTLLVYVAMDHDLRALFFGIFPYAGMAMLLALAAGERDTAAGRAAAARWLGVREWLQAHEEFAELPPAAVTTWDRYLSYGAAVGVTSRTSAILDLGMGDRRRVWSSYGGRWRQVRVRYPRLRPHLGARTGWLVALAAAALLPGALLFGNTDGRLTTSGFGPGWIGPLLGLAGVGYGLYVLVRAWPDRTRTRTVTGEVLWVRPWRRHRYSRKWELWLCYLAVDEGDRDSTTAWGLPSEWAGRVAAGDTVEAVVRRWSRRVLRLRITARGPRRASPPAPFTLGLVEPRSTGVLLENPWTPEP